MKLPSLLIAAMIAIAANQGALPSPTTLPHGATQKLAASLADAKPHTKHLWRDTPPINADGTINGYVEIARGDLRKWEFNIARHERGIDRMIPKEIGGYPINYGFVPQTISYDGDPFDILVLGPPLEGGQMIRGVPVGLMLMEDEKGIDSKIVVSLVDGSGKPRHQLTPAIQKEVGEYFASYKRLEPNAFSRVPGWESAENGVSLVRLTHAFFLECRQRSEACSVAAPK